MRVRWRVMLSESRWGGAANRRKSRHWWYMYMRTIWVYAERRRSVAEFWVLASMRIDLEAKGVVE